MADNENAWYGPYGVKSIPQRVEAHPPLLELVENPPSQWDADCTDEAMDATLRKHCDASLRQLKELTVGA